MTETILPIVLIFLVIVFGTVAVAVGWEAVRDFRLRKKAMDQLSNVDGSFFGTDELEQSNLLRRAREGKLPWLDTMATRLPMMGDLSELLERANLNWSPGTFVLVVGGVGFAAFVAGLLAFRSAALALLMAAVGAWLPYIYVKFRRSRRMNAFEAMFPEAIDLIGRAIRAGHPLSSGIKMAADETRDPVSGEFRRVFEQQRFGLPFQDALLSLADRVDLVDVRIFVTAVLIQREVGGNLAEILDKLSEMIRVRFNIRRQLRVYTAQGRMSGYVLAALPVGVGLMIFLMNPGYMITLFEEPMGRIMLAGAGLLQLLGFFWIRKVVDIEI